MNKKHLIIGGAAFAAVALVLYARSNRGASSTCPAVSFVRSKLPASWLDKSAAVAPTSVAINDGDAPSVRASDTDEVA